MHNQCGAFAFFQHTEFFLNAVLYKSPSKSLYMVGKFKSRISASCESSNLGSDQSFV